MEEEQNRQKQISRSEKKKQRREKDEKEINEIRTEREVGKYINRQRGKGISERGKNNARMGRVLHKTAGREKGRRRGRNTHEGEVDGAGGNINHSGRGGKTDKEAEKEKGTEEGRGTWRGEGFPVDWREGVICPIIYFKIKNPPTVHSTSKIHPTTSPTFVFSVSVSVRKKWGYERKLLDSRFGRSSSGFFILILLFHSKSMIR
jgi:hypothetical protein